MTTTELKAEYDRLYDILKKRPCGNLTIEELAFLYRRRPASADELFYTQERINLLHRLIEKTS